MFYKLSNTASVEEIEDSFGIPMEFPKISKPATVINGLEESTLPIITMDNSKLISFGIWGLLPQELEDNWKVYQNLTNTLNLIIEQIDYKNSLYSKALDSGRCIVITTGFFTSALHDGKMYPYHVHLKGFKPFGIAGLYNKLEDGFITCAILINKSTKKMSQLPNISTYMPIVFDRKDQAHWLNKKFKYENLRNLLASHTSLEFFAHPVSKEFYDNDLVYSKILDSGAFKKFLNIS